MNTKQIPKFPGAPKLEHIIQQLRSESFDGEVTVTFQNGKPVLVKINQTYKMNEL
jgi:hypothetical protein